MGVANSCHDWHVAGLRKMNTETRSDVLMWCTVAVLVVVLAFTNWSPL